MTFEAYCRQRWEFGKRRVYQMIEAAAVAEKVNHGALPPANEAQARELARLPKEQGGTHKGKGGRPKKTSSASGRVSESNRSAAASLLGVGRHEAEALETIFTTPGEEGEERQRQIPVPYHAFTRWVARKLKERR